MLKEQLREKEEKYQRLSTTRISELISKRSKGQINISTLELETQIQLILGWSKLLLGDDVGSSRQLPTRFVLVNIIILLATSFLVYS